MRTLNLIAAMLLFVCFAFISCQKEKMANLQSTTLTTSAINKRGIPQEGIHIYNEAVQTLATAEIIEQQATSRSRGYTIIGCNTNYDGYTKGQGSTFNSTNYPACISDLGISFNGEDELFFLVVPETPEYFVTYDISLTNMNTDLDLFLLALDAGGRNMDCKAISIGLGTSDELISATGLAPGVYAIIVDAYRSGLTSYFNLSVACSAVSANPPSILTSVNRVSFGLDGMVIGTFQQTGATVWKEIKVDPAGNNYDFIEIGRDDWNVYLRDTSRGVNIQLDLQTKKVLYSNDTDNAFPLYDILNSNDKMNGYLTSSVVFGSSTETIGVFTQIGGTNWKEIKADPAGNNYDFVEIDRDEWNVYLRDASRGVDIQLDLHTAKVMYSDDTGNAFELYQILSAE